MSMWIRKRQRSGSGRKEREDHHRRRQDAVSFPAEVHQNIHKKSVRKSRRIWKDLQDKEKSRNGGMKGKMGSFETVKKRTFEREEEDAERYKRYYGFDHQDDVPLRSYFRYY